MNNLSLSELRLIEVGKPLLVCRYRDGFIYSVATRLPSMRRDIVKVRLFEIVDTHTTDYKLTETDRHIHPVDIPTNEFEFREPRTEKELASCLAVLQRYKEAE